MERRLHTLLFLVLLLSAGSLCSAKKTVRAKKGPLEHRRKGKKQARGHHAVNTGLAGKHGSSSSSSVAQKKKHRHLQQGYGYGCDEDGYGYGYDGYGYGYGCDDGSNSYGKGKGSSKGSPQAPEEACVSDIRAWPWDAKCGKSPDFSLKGILKSTFCELLPPDNFLCWIYSQFLENLLKGILDPGIPIVSVCTGQFTGLQGRTDPIAKEQGCNTIWMNPTRNYGIVGARFWGGAVGPLNGLNFGFCHVTSQPGCDQFTWAFNIKRGVVKWLRGFVQIPGVDPITILLNSIVTTVLDFTDPVSAVGFGVSTRGGFQYPVYVYTPDGFKNDIAEPNVWFRGVLSGVYLPAVINAFLPTVGGHNVFFAVNGNEEADVIEGIMTGKLDPATFGDSYSMILDRRINTVIKLADMTFGLVPDVNIRGSRETGYLVRDPNGLFGDILEPGFYAAYTSNITLPFIGSNTNSICDFFAGLGIICPDILRVDFYNEFGFYRLAGSGDMGFKLSFLGVANIACTFSIATVSLYCGGDPSGNSFSVQRGEGSLSVWKEDGASGLQSSFIVSEEDFEELGSFNVAAVSYYEGKYALTAGGGGRKLGRLGSKHQDDFGFGRGQACVAGQDDVTIFDTRDESFANYTVQFAHDGSLRNCFTSCVLKAVSPKNPGDTPMCCEYRSFTGQAADSSEYNGACYLRSVASTMESEKASVEHNVYASLTFAEDFQTITQSNLH